MVLLNLSRRLLPKHLHTGGNREHVMNAAVTRNRERISRSGSQVRAADGVARGGDPPSPFCFLFLREKRDVSRGVFDCRDLFDNMGSLSPLTHGGAAWLSVRTLRLLAIARTHLRA